MTEPEQQSAEDRNKDPKSGKSIHELPDVLPILPLENVVIFPYMVAPLQVTGERSVQLIDDALVGDKLVGLCVQKDPKVDDPGPPDLYDYGTVGNILKMLKTPDGTVMILLQGLARMKILGYVKERPYLVARIQVLQEYVEESVEIAALTRNLTNQFQKMVSLVPHLPDELQMAVTNTKDPGKLADLITSNLNLSVTDRVEMLSTVDVKQRLKKLTALLSRELDLLELGSKIHSQVRQEMDKNQRDFFLREQLKAIRKELGEGDERAKELEEYRRKIEEAGMPGNVKEVALKEVDRLSNMAPGAAEYTVSATYLDWLITLPWKTVTEDHLDIERARKVLEEDHYNLAKVKERILEYLAVRKLRPESKGPILCFIGPPGVGKTSLGKSIARALGRKFVRLSLGGVRDEAEIRGHRRTYIGSLPGRIIQSIRTAGTRNPVFMMDEIDKLGADFRGDPSAALLEVLDPEQNDTFADHYLDVPFDLSQVMFITTANLPDPIPAPLRDRMETLEIPGYTLEEKIAISKKYLVPRRTEDNGLTSKLIAFKDAALREIIDGYTREAGLRNLEREIGTVCRKVARAVAEGETRKKIITKDNLSGYLGPRRFQPEIAERTSEPGVVTGLAWTPAGGDILFIESTRMPGGKGLTLTGQLGDVMKESAQAALSYIRSRSVGLSLDEDFFQKYDLHVHVPAGAIPKDGPSAGVAIATSLYSMLTSRRVRPDVAMTGEITLRGKVLPVGGIKEKSLAARRAGIKTIILPARNRKDLEDVPENARKALDFRFVDTLDEVWSIAFDSHRKSGPLPKKPK